MSARMRGLRGEQLGLARLFAQVLHDCRGFPQDEVTILESGHLGAEGGNTVTFRDLFGDKQSLVVYSYMFGPQRERP